MKNLFLFSSCLRHTEWRMHGQILFIGRFAELLAHLNHWSSVVFIFVREHAQYACRLCHDYLHSTSNCVFPYLFCIYTAQITNSYLCFRALNKHMLATNSPDPTFRYGQEAASGRAMEHSGCSSVHCGSVYVHAFIYVCNALLYIYSVCILYIHRHKNALVRAKQSS
jgi:hypothetical protein